MEGKDLTALNSFDAITKITQETENKLNRKRHGLELYCKETSYIDSNNILLYV